MVKKLLGKFLWKFEDFTCRMFAMVNLDSCDLWQHGLYLFNNPIVFLVLVDLPNYGFRTRIEPNRCSCYCLKKIGKNR